MKAGLLHSFVRAIGVGGSSSFMAIGVTSNLVLANSSEKISNSVAPAVRLGRTFAQHCCKQIDERENRHSAGSSNNSNSSIPTLPVITNSSPNPILSTIPENVPIDLTSQLISNPNTSPQLVIRSTPLERPMFRTFGFETGNTLNAGDWVLEFSGASFNNPQDFRTVANGTNNRSNDATFEVTYGLSDRVQISAALAGKDDTIFTNLVRPNSQLQILNNVIPIQVKWQYLNEANLRAALVTGVEIPNSFSALFFQPNRVVDFSLTDATNNPVDRLRANDRSLYWSIAAPVTYRASNSLQLHLNPQVSIFPSSLPATVTNGSSNNLRNAGIGFDGSNLNYYGTVIGLGFGATYQISPQLQLAADFTPIVAGTNNINSGGNNTLFSRQPVWNVGLQYNPDRRSAIKLYATNRFSATAASPANLLTQPGNDWAIGLGGSFIPDFGGRYPIDRRSSYPPVNDLLFAATGYPATTLPVGTIAYGVGVASDGQISPSVRWGVLDGFEVALSHSNSGRRAMPIETHAVARWGLLPDLGRSGISGNLDIGLSRIDGTDLQLGYSLYASTPLRYRLPGNNINLELAPKLIIPAQFQGVRRTLGVAIGGSWRVAQNTEIMGQITPILFGDNQLRSDDSFDFRGRKPVYSIGIRQLFPSGNSTYGLEAYYTNAAGSLGYQSLSVLPERDTQLGVRFTVLNGTPAGN